MAYNREDMITWNELAPSLQTVLKGYESGIEALNQKYQAEHLSLTDVEANLATMIQNLSQATALMQESLDELVSTQNEAKSGINALNTNQSQMREDLGTAATSIKEGIDACSGIEKTIRDTCSSIDGQIQELNVTQGAIRNLCSNLDVNVKNELDTLNSACGRLETTAKTISTNGSALSQTCDRIESVINTINNALSILNNTSSDMNGYCASLDNSGRSITTTLSSVNQTVSVLSTTCASVDTTCKSISAAMSTLNNTVRSIDTSSASVDATCKTISNTCLSMKTTLESLLTSINSLSQNSSDTRKAALDIAKDTSLIKETIYSIAQTVTDTKTNMNANHVEVKALLESIKQNGTGSGGGTTPTPEPEATFSLADVEGAVEEFGYLTEEEQILANVYKKNGLSDAQIVSWLRKYRASQQPAQDEPFDITKVEGGSAYAPLTEEEQILANSYKKSGKTDAEILTWLIDYRKSQEPEPDPVFSLEDIPGAVAEFGSLTEEEQATANGYKKAGKTDAEIISWLREKRLSEATFNLADVPGAVKEFGSLTEDEQTLANSYKRSGKTDAEIISWLREKRLSEATFNLADVEGAVAEFGSLTEEEQTIADGYKRSGKTDADIISWLRDKRLAETTFNLADVPGAVEEFGSLTADEQILANSYKKSGKTDAEILEAIRTARSAAVSAELSNYSGVLNAATDLDVHKESAASHSTTTTGNRYMMHHANTSYNVGDIVRIGELPAHMVLTAKNSGTTGQARPNFANWLGVTGNVEHGRASLLASRTAAIRAQLVSGNAPGVNAEILALHREVYDHENDQAAHSLTSTTAFTHKANHAYKKGIMVFANNLPPHLMLEAEVAGTTATTTPSSIVKPHTTPSYSAPTVTDATREAVLSSIETSLTNHASSADSHEVYSTNYLFSSDNETSRFIASGNSYRMCVPASIEFILSEVPGAVAEFGYLTEEEQTTANSMKKDGSSNADIIVWLRAYRASLSFVLSSVEGGVAEFVELSQSEQETANSMKKSGSSDNEIVAWLRESRANYNKEISNYTGITDVGGDFDVHTASVDSHKANVKSTRYMMHHANTSYDVGDVVRIGELPAHMALMATSKGVTASTRTDFATALGVAEVVTTPNRASLIQARTAVIRGKINNGSATVNDEILALHKEVYDHENDPNAHDSTSTSRFVHKTNHTYSVARERVFANNLPPHLMLEVYQTGKSGATAPGEAVKARAAYSYKAPSITVNNRGEILNGIERELSSHMASATAHKADLAEYLFDTSSSGYQVVPHGNSCYLCYLASLLFSLSDVEGAVEEFGALTASEQSTANAMKKSGSTDSEIIAWLRNSRATDDKSIVNYASITDIGGDLDVHNESVDSHKTTAKSNLYMMHHPNTNYDVGDMVRIGELPAHMALMATKKGTTSTTRPDFATALGVDKGVVVPSKTAKVSARTAAIRTKINNGSTTINDEILALHREVYDHEYDQNAHDLTSTSRFVHKTNHTYSQLHEYVFANNLAPQFMLEVEKIGTSASTAPTTIAKARSIPSYSAPSVTVDSRDEVLSGIERELNSHLTSTTAHKADLAEYLFETNSSGYQVVPLGSVCQLCALAS